MNTFTKPHDWFATRLLNPTKGIETLIVGNITPETAMLETRDKYKNTNKVKEIFTDDNGNFLEEEFNKFYDQIALEYAYLSSVNTENFILDSYEKSESNLSTPFGKVKQHKMTTEYVKNPNKLTYGLTEFNEWSTPEFSNRELAQMNKYWDNEKQAWSEKTVNEEGLLGRLTGKSLVYATWDEEGTHIDPMTGETMYHQKGEYKTDYWGNYYAETAENKEMLGKQYVTWSEVLTDDTSAWNVIDVFDSDNIEQSIPKTLIKTIGVAALYLIPYTRPYVAYSTAAIQLGRSLPQITKTFNSILDEDVEFDKLNTWDNYMQQFGHSRSDYSQQHIFSFENVMDMAVQSVSQLCQQRAVGELFGNIGRSDVNRTAAGIEMILKSNADKATLARWAKNPSELTKLIQSSKIYRRADEAAKYYSKLGEYASRGYLIATSTQDTYRLARQYGFDTQTSSVISLSTMIGVGTLFSTNYFRSMLYNSSDYEIEHTIRTLNKAYYNNALRQASGFVGQVASNEQKKGIFQTMTKGLKDFYNNHINSMNSREFGILDGMINESLEEVSEEIVADLSIQLGKAWNDLKSAYTGKEYKDNYKFLESDPLKRYATAAVGGAIGGGIFRMADRLHFQKTAFKNWNEMLKDNEMIMQELTYLVSQGKTNKILEDWNKLRQKNPIQGNISIFTKQPTDNQAETVENVVFESFIKHINDMDTFLSHNNLKIDKSVFDDIELAKGLRASWVITNGLQNALFNDYLHHVRKSVDIGAKLNEANVLLESATDADKAAIKSQIKELNEDLDFHKDSIRNILDAKDDSYLGRLMMESNSNIADAILPDTKNSLANRYYGKDYDKLEAAFKTHIDEKYDKLKESGKLEMRYYRAWNLYKELATSKELKSSILQNVGKLSGISQMFGLTINSLGNLSLSGLSNKIDPNIAFSLLNHIIANTTFDGNSLPLENSQLVSARIIGITKLPSYIRTKGGLLKFPVTKDTLIDSINKYFDDYRSWVKQNKNTTNTIPVRFNLIANADPKTLRITQNYLLEQVNNFKWQNGSFRVLVDNIEKVDYSPLLDTLDLLLKSIGYTNINTVNILLEIENKQKELGSNFRLSKEQEKNLYNIKEGIAVLKSLISGAYDKYTVQLDMFTVFGANNFLNNAFKDKKISLELLNLDENQIGELLVYFENTSLKIDDIIEMARTLAGQSTTQDKKTSYRYLCQQIDQIRSLFNSTQDASILPWDKFDMDSIMSEIEISKVDVDTDEFYIKNSIKNRNIILKFEREFYEYYNSLNDADKLILVEKIRHLCEEDSVSPHKIYEDTSNLSSKNEILFKSTDLFHFLMQTSLNHQSEIATFYKTYHDALTERCPFDTQEYVITSALKLLYNNSGNKNPWLISIQNSIDDLNKTKGDDKSEFRTVYNIIKLICFGGTGKTSTILPAIYYGIQKLFENKKCYFSANTQKQLDTLLTNMKLTNANMKTNNSTNLENSAMLISNLLEITNNEEEFKKLFANSIIFIDESTNIDRDDWLKLDSLAEKYNIKIIASGDTTQIGADLNIDQICSMSTPQLQDSKRSFSDIMTYNMLFWERFQVVNGGQISFSSKNLFELLYYKELGQAFEGIYIEDPQVTTKITGEYLEEFLSMHPLSDDSEKSVLIFTDKDNDTILSEKYNGKKINGYTITVVDGSTSDGYKSIQGSEWDYVFSDIDLNVKDINTYRSELEEIESKKREEERKTGDEIDKESKLTYAARVKEIYTLVSRARHGFVSTKQMYYGGFSDGSYEVSFDTNNRLSVYPPITINLSLDVINNYKDFKVNVLNGLIYEKSTSNDDEFGDKVDPPVTIDTPNAKSMVQCSPGFVWRDDVSTAEKLNITPAEWDRYKMIIYRAITENNKELLKKLPANWQNGEYLIKFQKTYGKDLVALGNWGREGKEVKGNHPWLIYSIIANDGTRIDMHLGMFHNEKGTANLPIEPTKPTLDLNEMHSVNEEGPIYYRINWDNVVFRRSRNPIAIQPETSPGLYQHLSYDGTTISFTTKNKEQSFSYMNTSIPIFVKKGDNSLVNIKLLLETLKSQNEMLENIYKLLIVNGIYQGEDIHNILELIGIDRTKDPVTWKARRSLPVEGEFISFVKLNSEPKHGNLQNTLKQWSEEYIAAQIAFNNQLSEIINIARSSKSNDEKIEQINGILANRVISDVSILSYGKNMLIDDGQELHDVIANILNERKELTSYNNSVSAGMWRVFLKVYTIAENADLLKNLFSLDQGLTDEEIDILKEIITSNKDAINKALEDAQIGANWSNAFSDKNIESGYKNIKTFIKDIEEKTSLFTIIYGFGEKYNFQTMHSILSKLNYQKAWSNDKVYKKLSPLFITTYKGVLRDNKISLINSGLDLISRTREKKSVTFTINKVVQPGQIHMYFTKDVKSSLTRIDSTPNPFKEDLSGELEGPSIEVVVPNGTWKYTRLSKKGNEMYGQYTATTDEYGITKITFSGNYWARLRFVNASDSGVSSDYFIGSVDTYNDPANYEDIKETIETKGLFIDAVVIKDGEVVIRTGNQIEITGEAAKNMFNELFKASDFISDNSQETVEISQQTDVRSAIINTINESINSRRKLTEQSTRTDINNAFTAWYKQQVPDPDTNTFMGYLTSISNDETVEDIIYHILMKKEPSDTRWNDNDSTVFSHLMRLTYGDVTNNNINCD